MKSFCKLLLLIWSASLMVKATAATLYVDLNSPTPVAPFASWATAATNIQDAIEASVPGDLVLVTNGIYATGGKVKFGDLTNRVALDKAITVQSVNGPWVTTIKGNGATNGTAAVRCAWITNGAMLQGFTLTAGATRTTGDTTNLLSGGAALCLNTNALLRSCVIFSNAAQIYGGGVFQGVILNSAIIGNRSSSPGAGAAYAALMNCTVISNLNSSAILTSRVTNTIAYYNSPGNYSGGTFAYSCTTPSPSGTSNIISAPQLLTDAIHLASTSPCRGTGTNLTTGTDLDGQAWTNPPSMGCDEWREAPVIVVQPKFQHFSDPVGFGVLVLVAGQDPFTCYWTRNGLPIENDAHFSQVSTTNIIAEGISAADVGAYQVVVSNAFGVTTSSVAQLVFHYVDESSGGSVSPFTSWSTAAATIQDAIDASADGDLVMVTNGIYAIGGKVMAGDLTNRIAINKSIAVRSVNGPLVTTIRGIGATNGVSAVRCAWLADAAILQGFTFEFGATRTSGDTFTQRSGGGVWCVSTNAIVSNCIIRSNTAADYGAGFYQGTLRNSYVSRNQDNFATGGGAVANANLLNCTVVSNNAYGVVQISPGVLRVTNSIVYYHFQNFFGGTFAYTCSTPLHSGVGNITNAPQFQIDGMHLSNISPCRGVGTNLSIGTDLFGQAWLNPPSMGCVEWPPAAAFEVQTLLTLTNNPGGFAINFKPGGQTPLTYHWFHDGVPVLDDGHFTGVGTTNLVVRKIRDSDAGNYWVVVSNSFGMATSQVAQVVIHFVDATASDPISPYTTWGNAATNIQDAIDAAQAGEFVMVTNGIYSTGGKIMSGDLLNRVAIDKPITVLSVNGYKHSLIEGKWDPVTTNGNSAVRGVWVGNGATFGGFTVRNGATRGGNFLTYELQAGGGIWAASTNAFVLNCMITNNAARYLGGGVYNGGVRNSIVTGNVVDGVASGGGGGAAYADLRNCTVYYNFCMGSVSYGAGTYNCSVRNSIVVNNWFVQWAGPNAVPQNYANYNSGFGNTYSYSCTGPAISGTGNIDAFSSSPQFLDSDLHIPSVSPCRGTGSPLYASGEDMDGEAWANPPSMGADEVVDANLIGPISLSLNFWQTNILVSSPGSPRLLNFWDSISGRVSRIDWNFGDGIVNTNVNYYASHYWTNSGTYTVTSTAYNNDNPGGVSASVVIEVLPLISPGLQSASVQTNGFKFSFDAQESARYTVQYATNLTAPVTWIPLQTIFFSPGGATQITDPAWTNAARFYRLLVQ